MSSVTLKCCAYIYVYVIVLKISARLGAPKEFFDVNLGTSGIFTICLT